ncbi:MAG: lysophospholipid acyltransferase family protein [Planctomycetales bacterium]|nr:lysophospholipid acyltransferase family protein [Planctomycetales bacterium]
MMEQSRKGIRWLDWLVYAALRIVICVIQALSLQSCQALARGIAWLAVDLLKIRDKVLEENLRQALPDLDLTERKRLKREMWEHLVLMVCEIAHAPRRVHETNWHRYITVRDRRLVVSRLLEDRPLVMVSGHFGNFEMAGFVAGLLGFSTFAIARELDNPYVHRFIDEFRRIKGQYMINKDGSAQEIKSHLDAKRTITLLGDQHAGPKGCWVDFFGRPASSHKAVAVFTLTADAPMVVCYVRRTGKPMQLEVGVQGEVDPRTMSPDLKGIPQLTKWYNERVEEIVRRTPGQYWWLHKRWKGEPPQRKKKKSAPTNREQENPPMPGAASPSDQVTEPQRSNSVAPSGSPPSTNKAA